jgi:hypothetical protein
MKRLLAASVAAALALPLFAAAGDAPKADAPPPPVSIKLGGQHGHSTPVKCGAARTAGGDIKVDQPTPDQVVITMTGVAVATSSLRGPSSGQMCFDLLECLEISIDDPKVARAKLTIEGRVMGLLRADCKTNGSAGYDHAFANLGAAGVEIIRLCLEPHAICGDNLCVNDKAGPQSVPVTPGPYTLHQTFCIVASADKGLGLSKAVAAEFSPDALESTWIAAKDPFHGVTKDDFGFQVTITVAPDDGAEPEKKDEKKPEAVPAPAAKPASLQIQ